MARFNLELPDELIKAFKDLDVNTEKMLGEMTKAGADVVVNNIKTNIPPSFADSDIMNCLKVTRVYKTKDDSINTKVGFYGYFINENHKRVPAPLVANVFEYGKSNFDKQPFFRKSFKKAQINKVMLQIQDKYIKGD